MKNEDIITLKKMLAGKTNAVKLPIVDLSSAKRGDRLVRVLGGALPVTIRITKVEDGIIHTAPLRNDTNPFTNESEENWWTFDQKTGMEIDTDLDWGPSTGITGSYITELIQ